MNNTFDIKRFALLMKRDIMQDWKKYTLQVAALLGIMLAFPLYYTYTEYDMMTYAVMPNVDNILNELNQAYVMMGTFLFIIVFLLYVSAMMTPISNKRKRIDYLMLPCSSLEKYLSRFLIHIVGFIIAFFICLFIADIIRIGVFSLAYPEFGVKALDLGILTTDKMFAQSGIFIALCTVFTSVVAFFSLGSTVWQKHVAIKNVVTLTVIILLTACFIYLITDILTPKGKEWGENFGIINISNQMGYMLTIILFGALSIFFWVLAYFRFKETEIINKW